MFRHLKPRHARGFFCPLFIGGNVTRRQGRQFFARRLRYFFHRRGETLVGRVTSNTPATFSYALLMDGSVACAARCLTSSALRRKKSLSDDIRGGSSNAPNQAASAALVSGDDAP